MFRIFFTFLLISLLTAAGATHVRSGELRVVRVPNSSQFYLEFIGYTDAQSGVQLDNADVYTNGNCDPASDPAIALARVSFSNIGNNIVRNVLRSGTFTLSNPSTTTFTLQVDNRNADIVNISGSVNVNFSVSTTYTFDNFIGFNESPILSQPNIDFAAVGEIYRHNPGAFDPDNDSISFELAESRMGCNMPIPGFVQANTVNCASSIPQPTTLQIDPVTGTLTWDVPRCPGEYNIAYVVKEYRFGQLIGTVIRDMQIIVEQDPQNRPPEFESVIDTCLIATIDTLDKVIEGSDPDGDSLFLEAYGGPFELDVQPANFLTSNPQFGGAVGYMNWEVICEHVREQPYNAVFRLVDIPGGLRTPLNDILTYSIKVVGPPPLWDPVNDIALENSGVRLNWQNYLCDNALRINIWRKIGGTGYKSQKCDTDILASLGYTQIASLPATNTTYFDDNNGEDFQEGADYCYVIQAVFPNSRGGGLSLPSDEICVNIPLVSPFITNVTVDSTDTIAGQITIRWRNPLEFDSSLFTPPFRYDLFETNTGNLVTSFPGLRDTSFVHSGINTAENQYNYRVDLVSESISSKRSSETATSAFLQGIPSSNLAQLEWQSEVPWVYEGFYQYIYRSIPSVSDSMILIDSILITNDDQQPYFYIDTGQYDGIELKNGTEYCYYVDTRGKYPGSLLPDTLINLSNIECVIPQDTVPPCIPILNINALNCEVFDYKSDYINELFWNPLNGEDCFNDAVYYTIYKSEKEGDPFDSIASTVDTFYIDQDNIDLADCYQITATDSFGNESQFSNVVCGNNCPYFELPNIITLNEDEFNRFFRPFREPTFVKHVDFELFNRWGKLLFKTDDNILIKWRGVNQEDEILPNGVYYYKAEVTFYDYPLEPNTKIFRGWVKLAN